MAIYTFKIDSYALRGARRMSGMLQGEQLVWRAHIDVYGGGYNMTLYFVDDINNAPDNYYYEPGKRGIVILPLEQYSWYVDMLRNESPVYAKIYTNAPNGISLYTGLEPIGEGENIA